MTSHGAIVLSTYSRPDLLRKCLESVYGCSGSLSALKVIVVQDGNFEVSALVESYQDSMTYVLRTKAHLTPLESINMNYWLAFEYAFDHLGVDWILCIEEETILSKNTLEFIWQIYDDHRRKFFFRGINLGSDLVNPDLRATYSTIRFGFNGNAGVIPLRTWRHLRFLRIRSKLHAHPFDGLTNAFWRTGFVVVPNLSKYFNYSWIGGTHVHANIDLKPFHRMKLGYELDEKSSDFKKYDTVHNWRADSMTFRWRDQPRAIFIFGLTWFFGPSIMNSAYKLRARFTQKIDSNFR